MKTKMRKKRVTPPFKLKPPKENKSKKRPHLKIDKKVDHPKAPKKPNKNNSKPQQNSFNLVAGMIGVLPPFFKSLHPNCNNPDIANQIRKIITDHSLNTIKKWLVFRKKKRKW